MYESTTKMDGVWKIPKNDYFAEFQESVIHLPVGVGKMIRSILVQVLFRK